MVQKPVTYIVYNVDLTKFILHSVFFYRRKVLAKASVSLIVAIWKPSVSFIHRNPVFDFSIKESYFEI